jgi:hypothetical protein
MEVVGDNKSESYDPAKEEKAPVMIKKRKTKKMNTILKKESRIINNNNINIKERKTSIKWDNETIESQTGNKKDKKLSEEMKRLASTRYKNYIYQDEEDEYLKNLIKVNEIKVTDDIIKNILQKFNEPKEYKKVRTFSTHINRAFNSFPNLNLKITESTDTIKVFDDVLDDESKITLKNTIINKFHKEIIGSGNEFHSAQDLKII